MRAFFLSIVSVAAASLLIDSGSARSYADGFEISHFTPHRLAEVRKILVAED